MQRETGAGGPPGVGRGHECEIFTQAPSAGSVTLALSGNLGPQSSASQLNHRSSTWKLKSREMVHSPQARDRPTGLLDRYASIHSFNPKSRRAWPVQV